MKKIVTAIFVIFGIILATPVAAQCATGDMGFFGGITEGTRLPKTTEQIIAATTTKKTTTKNLTSLPYKEIVFVSGQPIEMNGLLSVRQQGDVLDTSVADVGTYKVTYTVGKSAATDADNSISRTITFNVNWRREGNQIIKDFEASAWTEILTIGGERYVLDSAQSHFSVSILEDNTPAVIYSKGDLSVHAFYSTGSSNVTHDMSGSVYGYSTAWSNTETQRLDGQVYAGEWQLGYQIRPSVSVFKTLQYSKNEPIIISFDGNYREVMQNESGLAYDLFNIPNHYLDFPLSGSASLSTHNTFEQLPTYDLGNLKGHLAATDIHKLFSLAILTGEPEQYNPSQLITRGNFVTMLVKSIKLPITPVAATTKKTTKSSNEIVFTFPDVLQDRGDYPYIMAAYEAGIAGGRGQGRFYPDHAIQREEAIAMIMRTIGLSNLGLEPTSVTPFADDEDISAWAKKELYAALKTGLISHDASGNISPKNNVSKAEAAALINSLIEYMRSGIKTNYTDYIVNTTD